MCALTALLAFCHISTKLGYFSNIYFCFFSQNLRLNAPSQGLHGQVADTVDMFDDHGTEYDGQGHLEMESQSILDGLNLDPETGLLVAQEGGEEVDAGSKNNKPTRRSPRKRGKAATSRNSSSDEGDTREAPSNGGNSGAGGVSGGGGNPPGDDDEDDEDKKRKKKADNGKKKANNAKKKKGKAPAKKKAKVRVAFQHFLVTFSKYCVFQEMSAFRHFSVVSPNCLLLVQ